MIVDKYDRQIRLWGATGQRRLGNSKVALIGCDGAGIEALKNLVLPGVGQIHIWDNTDIKVQDLSQTFFFEYSSVGSNKAEEACKNLIQMNPDVKGNFHKKSLDEFLEGDSASQYGLVVFSGLDEEQAKRASRKMWDLDIGCIFITVVGYFFHLRMQKNIHFVESSNTASKKYYMRLTDPFPELKQYAYKNDVYGLVEKISKAGTYEEAKEDLIVLSDIPYPILLIQVYNQLPADGRSSAQIKAQLKRLRDQVNEKFRQNWDQASIRILDIYQTPDNYLPNIDIFEHPKVQAAGSNSHLVLKFLKAVSTFYKENKSLPQTTDLPDMHTSTANYLRLKEVYKEQHSKDLDKIVELMGENVDRETISSYINNIQNLNIQEFTPYADELEKPQSQMLNYFQSQKDLLITLRAYKKGQAYPELLEKAKTLQAQFGIQNFDERYLQEAFRSQGKTNINISSIAGAIVGQQAIKMITGCFEPANNGYLFDGANGVGYQVTL